MRRWYDRDKRLAKQLDRFKEMKEEERDYYIKGIMELVRQKEPKLLSAEIALEFPLEMKRRRWYDADPYLWLIFNTLKKAKISLHTQVCKIMEKERS